MEDFDSDTTYRPRPGLLHHVQSTCITQHVGEDPNNKKAKNTQEGNQHVSNEWKIISARPKTNKEFERLSSNLAKQTEPHIKAVVEIKSISPTQQHNHAKVWIPKKSKIIQQNTPMETSSSKDVDTNAPSLNGDDLRMLDLHQTRGCATSALMHIEAEKMKAKTSTKDD
ncbi:hypothetical protein Salat_1154800 [Sesamum alatum]|uniref:Uncharacterized protein n=1 Tax=Sesamum alatum TaxID=300844 RepID=A0AAE1YEE3_9LAMI|nr:hypothetical protein Salat_1154800 [Sesamum alatum]